MAYEIGEASSRMGQCVSVSYSIVSHSQGSLVRNLLEDIRGKKLNSYEIILTLNKQEDEGFLEQFSDLPIRVVRNKNEKGFGQNHNAAFSISTGDIFVVLNPDIRLLKYDIAPVEKLFCSDASIGACAPEVVSSEHTVEDSVRYYPTLLRIFKRFITKKNKPDYTWTTFPIQVDWAAGMFVAFRREAFKCVQGFDESYYMYYEDADICRRLRSQGWKTFLHPGLTVVHDAQRASRKSLRHLKWHVASILRVCVLSKGKV